MTSGEADTAAEAPPGPGSPESSTETRPGSERAYQMPAPAMTRAATAASPISSRRSIERNRSRIGSPSTHHLAHRTQDTASPKGRKRAHHAGGSGTARAQPERDATSR